MLELHADQNKDMFDCAWNGQGVLFFSRGASTTPTIESDDVQRGDQIT